MAGSSSAQILIVDDDAIILDSLSEFLRLEGYQTQTAKNYTQAVERLKDNTYSLVITDVNMPDGDGMELLSVVKREHPQTVVLVITGYGTIESAVEAIKKGAYDYLTKPVIDDELIMSVERALGQQNLISENRKLRSELAQKYNLSNVLSQNHEMSRIFELIEAVADSKTTILMCGASGTGKSMLARAIHYRSYRRDKPFVEVSCGALPESLLESELFGHVRGSFTGAVSDKEGKFLAADEGTIFLDEISSASPAMQVKLLRVLQDRQFEPVGSNETKIVDTRVILASNKDLAQEVREGNFREDLYYRINVVTINLPQLHERAGDVPLLANHFVERFVRSHGRGPKRISDEAMEKLTRYPWPGNVRELENVIERAVLLSKGELIGPGDFPGYVVNESDELRGRYFKGQTLKEALSGPERSILQSALESHQWNRQETAQALDINRTTLYKKMKRYGLDKAPGSSK